MAQNEAAILRWLVDMDREYGLEKTKATLSSGIGAFQGSCERRLQRPNTCLVCGSPAKRKYCTAECRNIARRDYLREWQNTSRQRKRLKRWRRDHRAERAQYNHRHYEDNRDRYLAMMKKAHQKRKESEL